MSYGHLAIRRGLLLLIVGVVGCKSIDNSQSGLRDSRVTLADGTQTNVRLIDGSLREEFDRGTANNFEFQPGADYTRSPLTFCYRDNEFSVYNAFWMTFLSTLSYQPSEFIIKTMNDFHLDAVERYRGPGGQVEKYLQAAQSAQTPAEIAAGMGKSQEYIEDGLNRLSASSFVRVRDGKWSLEPSKIAVYPVLPKMRFMFGEHQTAVNSWFTGRQTFTAIDAQAFWLEFPKVAFLIFRGTQNTPDIATDADFRKVPFLGDPANGMVHSGFNKSLNVMWDQIDEQIKAFELKHRASPAPIFIGGHSLGGAVGALTAARLLMEKEGQAYRYNSHVYGLYTIGSPRVGTQEFNDRYFATAKARKAQGIPSYPIVRIRHGADIVTRVPYQMQGFKHLGKMMFIPNQPEDHNKSLYSDYLHPELRQLWLPAALESEAYREYALRNFFQGRDVVRDHYVTGYFNNIKKSMLAAQAQATRRGISVCDTSLHAGREDDYRSPLLEFTHDREGLVVGVHKSSRDKLSFAVRQGQTERYHDIAGEKYIHESVEYRHRAVKFSVAGLGDFVLFFDSRTAFSTLNPELPRDHPQQPRNGCGLQWFPEGISRQDRRVFFPKLKKQVPCEAVAAYGQNIWGGLFRDTWRRAGPR